MTENIRRHRGAKILAALVDHHHGATRWEQPRSHPDTATAPPRGRFDPHTRKWDYHAGPRSGIPQPLITRIVIPPDPRIRYPGEVLYLRPPDLDTITLRLHALGVLWAVHEYAREPTYTIASYWPSDNLVRWGRAIPDDLRVPLARAATTLSDLFHPVGSNP